MPYEEFIVTEDIRDTDARQLTPILRRWEGKTGFIKFFSHHHPFVMNTPPTIEISIQLMDLLNLVFENKTMTSLIQKHQLFCRLQTGIIRDKKAAKMTAKMAEKLPSLMDKMLEMLGYNNPSVDHAVWIFWTGDADLTLEIKTPWGERVNENNPYGKNNVRWFGKTKKNFWQTTHAQSIVWTNPNPGPFIANISKDIGGDFTTTKYKACLFSQDVELQFIEGNIEPGDTHHLVNVDSPNIIDGSYVSLEEIYREYNTFTFGHPLVEEPSATLDPKVSHRTKLQQLIDGEIDAEDVFDDQAVRNIAELLYGFKFEE